MRTGMGLAACILAAVVIANGCVGSDPAAPSPATDGGPPNTTIIIEPPPTGDSGPTVDAGPFDPSYYGNLELWLRADVGATVTKSYVTSWQDSSGKKRPVKVPTSDTYCQFGPTVLADAIHGLPILRFNGGTQCMIVGLPFSDFTNGFTFFTVFRPENCDSQFTGTSSALFESYDKSTGPSRGIAVGRNPTPAQNASGDALLTTNGKVGISGGASWVPAKTELLTFRLPTAHGGALVGGTARVDGVAKEPMPNNPVIPDVNPSRLVTHIGFSAAAIANGGNALYCGGIGEMLVYSRALTDAELVAVETYLKTRWAL